MTKYEKFTVESIQGRYAQYTSKSGTTTLTSNFGFNEGDVVEIWDYDGYAPKRIDVNGETIWTEENRRKWWHNYDPKCEALTNPYCKDHY